MFTSLKSLIILLVSMLALSGCGDLLGKKVVKRQLDSSFAEVSCELDIDKFSEIMHENIEPQIRCLGESLNLFIKIVNSGKPGYISRTQLESYLSDFRPDVKPEVVRALGSVFQLGHLITGEDPNYISKETVDKVIDFAIVFNRKAALDFGPIFENKFPVTYALHQHHRSKVTAATTTIIQALLKIFNINRNGQIHRLSITELIDTFTTDANRDDMEKFKKMLFLKGVILGGKNDEITHIELQKLIQNFNSMLLIGLDIARYKYIELDQKSILQLLKLDVDDAYDVINQDSLGDRRQKVLFTMEEALDAAKILLDGKDFDVEKYRNLIVEVKKLAMNGNETEVKGIELNRLFDHAKSLLRTGTIFHSMYEMFKAQLDQPIEVDIDFSDYRHTYPDHQNELDQFERIVKRYRFMKGEFISSYYTRGIKRNANAVFEIAAIEYILKYVFVAYGRKSPNTTVGGYSMDKTDMERIMKKFETELIDLGLILPQRAVTTANNISLLGSLFQYQSDTNELMDVNEATEFAETVFTSLNVADDLIDYMKNQKCQIDQFDRIEPGCFRANFWKGLCLNYRKYYPLLFDSLNTPATCEEWKNTTLSSEYLDRAIRAGRSCMNYTDGDKEEIPYASGDIMTLMVVLLHSETTIIRWDVNKNNYMDADEVNRAYEIYGPALDGFLKDKNPIIKKFKKQIYQYMIKYEKVPDEKDFKSILQFVKFIMSFDKKAPAQRKTIASLLMAIGEQNAKMQTGPVFNCSLLRDPDHVPRTTETSFLPEVDNRPDYSELLSPYLHLAN
jgi:hypothetical protein